MFPKRIVLALRALLMASLLAGVGAGAAAAGPVVNSGHIESELVAQEAGIAPGGTIYVALRQKIQPGWHTYWRNPGDAGEATRIDWTLPAGWAAGDMVWPTPKTARLGPLLDYAYEGEVLIPVPITASADARPGTTISLSAAVSYLVCEQVCIPEEAKLSLLLPVVAGAPPADPAWGARIGEVLAKAPKPAGLKAVFKLDGQTLRLAVTGGPLKGADLAGAYFFPYSPKVIEHAADQTVERGPEGLTLSLKAGYDFVGGGTPPTELSGVLATKGGDWEITANAGEPPPAAAGLGPPPAAAKPDANGGVGGLFGAMALAFLGGLILNLMPCVFPVLSLKAASLAGHAHDSGKVRLQGLVFLLGVMATFLALAGALLALRAGGAAAGWGFQLQSPPVVAGLALLMLLVALNMSGVFEIGTSVQGVGTGASAKGGAAGAFFTGALAVVVAAPCTAPFMAGALGYALTQPAATALAVFAALALGFAAPFVAVAFVPGLLRLLPRPGAWMDVLKKGLAFPMYGAALWLTWVFAQQSDAMALGQILAAGVLAAFGAWLHGLAQARRAAGGKALASTLAAVLSLVGALALAASASFLTKPPAAAASVQAAASGAGPTAEPWSPERVAALRAEGRPVLVDFTAAWCVTCQVNEKIALSSAKVAKAFEASDAVLLKADWTNRDPAIATALAEFDRVGVPLYVVYPRSGEPVVLPQLLTEGMVIEAIERAGRTQPST